MSRDYYLKVDSVDLRPSFGFVVSQSAAPWERPLAALNEQPIFEKDGVTLMTSEPSVAGADLLFDGAILGADADDFETKFTALRRFLGPKGRKVHTLVFGNQTARQVSAYYLGASGGPTGPQMVQQRVPVQLHFRALDPYDQDTSDTTLGPTSASTPVSVPLGFELSYGTITIDFGGSAASVTVTYKHYDGTTKGSMTFTHAFVNADQLVIDLEARTISLNGTRDETLLTSGFFFRFNPVDGDPTLSHWPTVETNAGTITLTYRRRY